MRTSPRRSAPLAVALAVLLLALFAPVAASGQDEPAVAPLDQEGPALRLEDRQLEDGLHCPADLEEDDRVVLLVHGTGVDAETTWSWGYEPALEDAGVRVCTVDLLGFGLADVQVSSERVVYAIRTIHERVDRRIAVVGYSQGAQAARFGLRFWPDLRAHVDDLVLVGAPISGTTALETLCARACAAAFWQFRAGSGLVSAINSSALVFPGIDTTSIYTYFDQIVTPNDTGQASTLPGATNIAIQDVCEADHVDHVALGMSDPVAFALVLDAIEHDGPAQADRLPVEICEQTALPGLTFDEAESHLAKAKKEAAANYLVAPLVRREPELRCYITVSCTAGETNDGPASVDGTDGRPFDAIKWVAAAMLVLGLGFVGLAVGRSVSERRRRNLEID